MQHAVIAEPLTAAEELAQAMRHPGRAVFFSELVDQAIEGKTLDEQLDALGALIERAQTAKEHGFGPPVDEINRARRKWLAIYETLYPTERFINV